MSEISEEQSQQMQLVQREIFEDDEDVFEIINNLVPDAINAGDVKKFHDAGIYTCKGLLMHTKKSLTGITGLSEAKVDTIYEAVLIIVNDGYIAGTDALLKLPTSMSDSISSATNEHVNVDGGGESSSGGRGGIDDNEPFDAIAIPLDVFIELADHDQHVGTLNYQECLELQSIEELNTRVEELLAMDLHLPLPNPYNIRPQKHFSRGRRSHVDLPTSYKELIEDISRILLTPKLAAN